MGKFNLDKLKIESPKHSFATRLSLFSIIAVGILLSAVPTRSHSPPKRANAIVAVVRVVVVQRAVRIDVADVVGVRRIRRIKMYPERFSSSRFVPLLPRGRHVLHFKRKF